VAGLGATFKHAKSARKHFGISRIELLFASRIGMREEQGNEHATLDEHLQLGHVVVETEEAALGRHLGLTLDPAMPHASITMPCRVALHRAYRELQVDTSE
jgi:hypothetical protein